MPKLKKPIHNHFELKKRIKELMATHSINDMIGIFKIPNCRVKINCIIDEICQDKKDKEKNDTQYFESGKLHDYYINLKQYLNTETNPNHKATMQQEVDWLTSILYE